MELKKEKCEGCKKECDGDSDILACDALEKANQCRVCRVKDKLRIHTVVIPNDSLKFMFVTCNCGYSGEFICLDGEIASKNEYRKAIEKWNHRS